VNILVAYAVDPEFGPWRKLRKFREVAAGDFTIQRTEISRATVDFVVSGMGPGFALRAMQAVDLPTYAICVACGFAGSLRMELGVGDIVIARAIRPAEGAASIACDAGLVAEAVANGGKAIDVLVSAERVASTVEEKAHLATSGSAVDMESITVVAEAQRCDIPAVAIRAISDRHDQAMPVDFSAAVDERGQVSIGRVLRMVTGNPAQISGLMRLGRDSKTAAESLARFLDAYVEKVSTNERWSVRTKLAEVAGRDT
jgi:nucleoside phosphorylase